MSDADLLVFYDLRGDASLLTVGEVTGLSSSFQSLANYAAASTPPGYSPAAMVVTVRQGSSIVITNDVLILPAFWNYTQYIGDPNPFQVMVHELLHFSSRLNDIDLATRLTGNSFTSIAAASQALTNWLANCFQ